MAALNTSFIKTNSYKLVFLGDSAVGKSCIVSRFIRGEFSEFQEPTIGAAFNTATVDLDDFKVKFEIWDTAGQERYRSLAPMYYRGAKVAIVVFDITCYESYKGAITWVTEIMRKGDPKCVISIIGNKHDLDKKRTVNKQEVENFAESNDIYYNEVSAKTGYNIDNLFRNLARRIPKDLIEKKNETVITNYKKPKKIRSFC